MRQPGARVQVPNVAQTPMRRRHAVPMRAKQETVAEPPWQSDPGRRSRQRGKARLGAPRVSIARRQTKSVGVAWLAGLHRIVALAGTIVAIVVERAALIALALCATPSTTIFKRLGARSARVELHSGARLVTFPNSQMASAVLVLRRVNIGACSRCRQSCREGASV